MPAILGNCFVGSTAAGAHGARFGACESRRMLTRARHGQTTLSIQAINYVPGSCNMPDEEAFLICSSWLQIATPCYTLLPTMPSVMRSAGRADV